MQETIRLATIPCECKIGKLAAALAPIKGINDIRVQVGTQSLICDYDDAARDALYAAIAASGFVVDTEAPALV